MRARIDRNSTACKRPDPPPQEILDFARQQMPQAVRFEQWAGHNTPETLTHKGWLKGFPHLHAWPPGTVTMVCYLTEFEGGRLEIADNEGMNKAASYLMKPGTCAFIDASEWHGVRPVTAGERLTVILTGFTDWPLSD